jgi:hypothetical protein
MLIVKEINEIDGIVYCFAVNMASTNLPFFLLLSPE